MNNIDQDAVRMTDLEKYVVGLGKGQWTNVYQWNAQEKSWQSPADDYTCLCSVVVPRATVEEYLKTCDRSFDSDFGRPAFDDECGEAGAFEYSRYGDCHGTEPIVMVRRIPLSEHFDIQVSEEFRMFHDLFPLDDLRGWYRCSDNGTVEPVVMVEGSSKVVISTHRLKQYLAAKGMLLLVQFDYERYFVEAPQGGASTYHKGPLRNASLMYEIESLPARGLDDFKWKSFLYGKKLIQGYPREKCGIEPYRDAEHYPDFKTGYTNKGETVAHSSDPASMGGGFMGTPANPGPYFPVAFERGVLAKYYADHVRYSVEDGMLRGNIGWVLPIDNDRRDCVAVALKDLGTVLPVAEQGIWLSHNIIGDGSLSPTSKCRWIGGEFCDPEMPDLVFPNRFSSFQADWLRQNHWPLFLDLAADDQHLLDGLHTPLAEVQEEFEPQIQALAKILPDSLNEKELRKRIKRPIPPNSNKIAVLEMAMVDTGCLSSECHIEFLRLVQKLRDGVAHRKPRGDDGSYREAAKEAGLTDSNYTEVFDQLLVRANGLLDYLLSQAAFLGH
jgi:hypothetical protein